MVLRGGCWVVCYCRFGIGGSKQNAHCARSVTEERDQKMTMGCFPTWREQNELKFPSDRLTECERGFGPFDRRAEETKRREVLSLLSDGQQGVRYRQ